MYDPLTDSLIPSTYQSPDSFWASGRQSALFPMQKGAHETDVAIIGGGYTGLSTAYHLRQRSDLACCVIEANQPGWGCSGRNGGFVLPGTGRLSTGQMAKKWGKTVSQSVYAEYLQSIDTVSQLIDQGIDCERTLGGYLKVAHKPELLPELHQQAKMLSKDYGDSIVPLNKQDVESQYLSSVESYGGIFYPNAYAINPWLFAQGLAKQAISTGAQVFGNSPVIGSHFDGKHHHVQTANGSVKAKHLIIATNAYTPRKLFPVLTDRTFPVISSVLVTAPLTQQQLSLLGIKAGLMVMDTRPLKYYFRLLPDNRLLFGGRGAIRGKEANSKQAQESLKKGLNATFPTLPDLHIDHFWSGWVGVSFDNYPRLHYDQDNQQLYSAGYCGAGLAFSVQSGKRLAQLLMADDQLPALPYWQSPLKRFPFPALRRPALRAFYWLEALKRAL